MSPFVQAVEDRNDIIIIIQHIIVTFLLETGVRHLTPASSEWTQLWTPSPLLGQSTSLDSVPVQPRLSRTI